MKNDQTTDFNFPGTSQPPVSKFTTTFSAKLFQNLDFIFITGDAVKFWNLLGHNFRKNVHIKFMLIS